MVTACGGPINGSGQESVSLVLKETGALVRCFIKAVSSVAKKLKQFFEVVELRGNLNSEPVLEKVAQARGHDVAD